MGVGKLPQELISLLKSTFYSRKEAANVGLTQIGQATDGLVLTADGASGAAWEALPALADHDHTGDAGDGGMLEADHSLKVTGGTTGHVLTVQADDTIAAAALPAAPIGYMLYKDQKAQNTAGGTFTGGGWRTRVLNTEVFDTNGDGSLASNQITLVAGTYLVRASAPAFDVHMNQCRFQNITDGTTVGVGTNALANTSSPEHSTTSFVTCMFTIASSKVFELQHYSFNTGTTNGFGYPCNFTTEVYAQVEIVRLA